MGNFLHIFILYTDINVLGAQVTTETQTRIGLKQRKQEVVNSQVQTAGEYLVKPRRSRNTLTSQGSQCRISPEKRVQQSIASRRNSGSVVTFNQMLPRTEMTTQE